MAVVTLRWSGSWGSGSPRGPTTSSSRTPRSGWVFGGAVLTVLALGACTSPGDPDPQQDSTSSSRAEREQSWADRTAACLKDAGWDVTVNPDGSVGPENGIPEAQADQYEAAFVACDAPVDAVTTPLDQLTDEQWSELYAQEVRTVECLRAHDIDVPTPPSEATFVDAYQSSDPWTAYGFVGSVDEGTWVELNAACPQPQL